jgi:ABC-type multidrug transport system fused ATPase/permease subunit
LDALLLVVAGIFVLQVASSVFAYFGRWWSAQAGEAAWAKARNEVHDALHKVPPGELLTPRVGDLVARIVSDSATLKTFVQNVVPTALTTAATLAATAVVITVVEPRLLVVIAAPLPIAIGILWLLRGRITRASRELLDRQADLQAAVTESVAGREPIRAYGAAALFNRRVQHAGDAVGAASLALERDQAALYPVSNLVLSVVLLAALAGGGYYAVEGSITVGGLVVTYFYLSRALGPIRSINGVVFGWQRTTAALARIDEIMGLVSPPAASDVRRGSTLDLENVSFGWGAAPTLEHVDLGVSHAECVAIVAPSGAGKSTAARLILGILAPDEGRVLFGELEIVAMSSAAELDISYLGQHPFLFRGSLRDNIDFGRGLEDSALVRAMDLARVEAFAQPRGGLDMSVEEGGRNLSGGQQKRVALARALAARPQLLVIDQLATDLESDLVAEIFSDLRALGLSIVYFGHAVPPALEPHAVYAIVDGHLILQREERDALASG